MDLRGVDFKPRAFEKAADTIEELGEDVKDLYKRGGIKALDEIPGVGRGIAERIEEFLKTGKVKEHQKMKKDFPVDLDELTSVEGIGPKTAFELYEKLKIKNLKELEKAAKAGKIGELEGFGAKTEEKILHGIEFLKKSAGRFLIGFTMPHIEDILEQLKEVSGVKKVESAGSVRRMQETVGDLDILVVSSKPSEVMDFFVSMDEVASVQSKGKTKSSVRLKIGMDVDLLVVDNESFGAAWQYFTGNKHHNIELREVAMEKGYKLNEYGLFKGKKVIAGRTEKEIYEKLGFDWMPPELRTNTGELEAAKKGELPNLIEYDDVKGDLQIQTDWTDGAHSIEEMARAAIEEGLEYILITDHTKALAVAGGLDEKDIKRQMKEIEKVNEKLGSKFKVLKGAEVNIMKDGTLDIDDETLAKLDFVGAAVHSIFTMSEKDMTGRIKKAMDNPNIDMIFHPTGRIIQQREAYKLDMDELIKHAKKTKTIMEINAYPNRLDLKDEHVRKGVGAGIKFSISTDAHNTSHLQYLRFGIAQARRGWVEKKDVVNTRSWRDLLKFAK